MRDGTSRAGDDAIYLVCTQASLQSGATYALSQVAQIARDGGYRVTVAGPWPAAVERFLRDKGLSVDTVAIQPLRGPRAWMHNLRLALTSPWQIGTLLRRMRKFGATLVHANEVTDVVALIAARLARLPLVLHIRAHFASRFQSRIVLGIADLLVTTAVVPSRSVEEWIRRERPSLADRTEIIYEVAFDPDEFRSADGARIRDELGITHDRKLVLLISKLGLLKGHMVFLDAAEQIAASNPSAVFAIVGDVMTDRFDEARQIRQRASEVARSADVRLLGFRTDVPDLVAAADLFVHCPIYPDPFPTVIPEAMTIGCPVIGSRIGGIPEQIQDEVTGLLVEAGDAKALAAAIERLLRDGALRERLGTAAGDYARIHFSIDAQREAQLAHYERILGRKGSPSR